MIDTHINISFLKKNNQQCNFCKQSSLTVSQVCCPLQRVGDVQNYFSPWRLEPLANRPTGQPSGLFHRAESEAARWVWCTGSCDLWMKKVWMQRMHKLLVGKKPLPAFDGARWLAHVWGDWLSLAFCSRATGIYLHSTVSCITWGKFVKSQGTGQLAIQTNRLFIPKPYPRFYVYDMNQSKG